METTELRSSFGTVTLWSHKVWKTVIKVLNRFDSIVPAIQLAANPLGHSVLTRGLISHGKQWPYLHSCRVNFAPILVKPVDNVLNNYVNNRNMKTLINAVFPFNVWCHFLRFIMVYKLSRASRIPGSYTVNVRFGLLRFNVL